MPTKEQIAAVFENTIAKGDMAGFFSHVDPNVDWKVKGTFCKISGNYKSAQEFRDGTHALSSTWATPLKLVIQDLMVDGNQACVELKAVDTHCKNGLPFTNEYAWLVTFNEDVKIVRVRAYMDTDLVTRAIEQNPQ